MPDTVPKGESEIPYTSRELFRLLEYTENFQHQRIGFFLVAESLFFAGAAATISHFLPTLSLSIAGIVICYYFYKINMKQQIRLSWLIDELRKKWLLYDDYASCVKILEDHSRYERYMRLAIPKLMEKDISNARLSASTSWVFTFGIPQIIFFAWCGILIHLFITNVFPPLLPILTKFFSVLFITSCANPTY